MGGMSEYKQGEVYLIEDKHVPYPQRSGKSLKLRPVVIVEDDTANTDDNIPTIMVAPISTTVHFRVPQDLEVSKSEASLKSDSRVQLNMIHPVRKDWLVKKIGIFSDERIKDIRVGLLTVFGFLR